MTLDLTRQEKQVIIFLVITALIGIGIIGYKSLVRRPKVQVTRYESLEKEARQDRIININTAAKEELTRLNGIGPALAEAIIAYRSLNGPFNEIEGLKSVKGIGPSKFENIKEHIRTE